MEFITIDNITENDIKKKQLRILTGNKFLFPQEIIGKPVTYNLNFSICDDSLLSSVKYKIGSHDRKSRSGILKLGSENYESRLKIKLNSILEIRRKGEKYVISTIK